MASKININYRVVIPFNNEVLLNHGVISGVINENEKIVLDIILKNPNITSNLDKFLVDLKVEYNSLIKQLDVTNQELLSAKPLLIQK